MITGLVIPANQKHPISDVSLEPENFRVYAAALGGRTKHELTQLTAAPWHRHRIEIHALKAQTSINLRASLLAKSWPVYGPALITGIGNEDLADLKGRLAVTELVFA